ncbi:MAG: TetR/AcrR family transcriptional regulator [Candidatus Azobacteroides sp.]|nr:TetR/AcrR family transcriptional regulator [Candidatus Azobacteroides sp.]
MTVSKTRDRLIEVARQLFARHGVENTTMNDISQASEKGRRTLYTYFKSKKEIYQAVTNAELDIILISLSEVTKKNLPADRKLLEFINVRLKTVKDVVFRNGTLRADFFRDICRVENVRRNFDKKEIEFVEKILSDGVREGIFRIEDTFSTAEVLHYALKGLEVPYIRGTIADLDENEKKIKSIIDLMFFGILKPPTP